MNRDTSVCVFLKPPIAGKVKTRLIPTVGAEGAAALAEAFFRDTWDCVQSLRWAVPIIATTDSLGPEILPTPESQVWLQGGGGLGTRIERILRRALRQSPFAMALGADSPGIPKRFLERAHEALQSADAVLGPSDDGGFYLLGVRQCAPGLLTGIPWSQPTTFAHTLNRLNELGLKPVVLESWYDIDRPEDLERLRGDVGRKAIAAPHTGKVLLALESVGVMSPTVASNAGVFDGRAMATQLR